jgi:predicted outer membrane repeat protein
MKKLITLLILTVIASAAFCKTITVTSSADSGAGSLRQAVLDAESGDIIIFDENVTIISLLDQIDIDKNISIIGNAENSTVLKRNGNGTDNKKHFHIMTGAEVVLNNLTLQDSYTYCSGGAIDNNGKLTLNNCVLKNNKSANLGGAIYSNGLLYANNCTFSGNNSNISGGAISSPQIFLDGCTFKNNSSSNDGSAIGIGLGFSKIENCLFEKNTGAAATIVNNGLTTINNCIFRENITTNDSPSIRNHNEIIVSNSIFTENKCDAGGIFTNYKNTATLINCIFYKNILTANTPAVYLGVIRNYTKGILNIINSTIVDNTGVGLASDVNEGYADSIYLYNNIFYNNIAQNKYGYRYDVYIEFSSENNPIGLFINAYNNIIGITNRFFNTTNLIDVDPLFMDITNNNYGLQASSPAIDAGNNSFYLYNNYPKDLQGNYRIDNLIIDLGAYEYQSGNPLLSNKHINNDQLKIYTMDKNIVIANTTKPVSIYNLQGTCIAHGIGNVFTVPASGVYIVRVEEKIQKVIIK